MGHLRPLPGMAPWGASLIEGIDFFSDEQGIRGVICIGHYVWIDGLWPDSGENVWQQAPA